MLEKLFSIGKQKVVLVDENDNEIGTKEKLAAHRDSDLHRAFSLFVFNKNGELLLQQRALNKYHSGGLWSNTCCSHTVPGEDIEKTVHRKLKQEMGFDCPINRAYSFKYKIEFSNGLSEHEYDHVFIGKYDGNIKPSKEEVANWRWITLENLKKEVKDNPDDFTYWFKLCFERAFVESSNK